MPNLISKLEPWANAALGFLYPEVCQVCGQHRAEPGQGYVCEACRSAVHFIEPPFCLRCGLPYPGDITTPFECGNCRDLELHFCRARSAVKAEGAALHAIHRFKYHRELWFELFLGDLLVRASRPDLAKQAWDQIIPVPLHPLKQREREFNQAERLARLLSQSTGIPVNRSLLLRRLPTPTQTRLTRAARARNMRSAFALREPCSLEGQRLILLDDVFTTGATTSACAKVLKQAGAETVVVWTVARGV